MRRGEIVLVDIEPIRGSEASGLRPGILVSNEGANATAARLTRGVITFVPVTTNIASVYPFQVFLPAAETGLRADSKAQAEQVRSVDIVRVGRRVGRVPPRLMREVDEALRLHLAL